MAVRKKKKRKGLRLKHVVFLIIIIYVLSIFLNQSKMMKNLVGKKMLLENEIKELEKDIEDLNKDIENSDSLEFVEKVAREELGMVKPREILYIDIDKVKDSIFRFFKR